MCVCVYIYVGEEDGGDVPLDMQVSLRVMYAEREEDAHWRVAEWGGTTQV